VKAAVYRGARRFEVAEIDTPEPRAGQVLVQVKQSAICGTDVHAFMYDLAPAGAVLGHEIAGVIAAVGPGVERWQVGQRVVAGGGDPPPDQPMRMRAGPRYNYRTMGFAGTATGGYAQYQLLPEWRPTLIPDGVPDTAAALTEPCSVAVHAVRRSAVRVGDTVAVIGAGPIGLLTMQVARAACAARVLVSEPAPARAEAARRLGAEAVGAAIEVEFPRADLPIAIPVRRCLRRLRLRAGGCAPARRRCRPPTVRAAGLAALRAAGRGGAAARAAWARSP